MTLKLVDQIEKVSNVALRLDSPSTRRGLLGSAILAGLGALSNQAQGQGSGGTDPGLAFKSLELRLLRRVTYGLTESDGNKARSMGFTRYLEYQLNHTQIEDSACTAQIAQYYPRLGLTVKQLSQFDDDWVTGEQLVEATLHRRIATNRQLFERMVEFWNDHFSTHRDKVGGWLSVPYDRDVIRANALGKFPDLLVATAKSAAMMIYLDNAESYGSEPNQNYAREVMELHTMGVGSGYTQQDVVALAKILTGWSMIWDDTSPDNGKFTFYDWAHDNSTKTFLGVTYQPNGIHEGENALRQIAATPAAASFISKKMCRYLLRYDPPTDLIARVAQVYRSTGGDIKQMIRAILTARYVQAMPVKHKRPAHLLVSALRSLRAQVSNLENVRWSFLENTGHVPFDWAPPNGFPDVAEYWSGLVLPRWNLGLDLCGTWETGLGIDCYPLVQGLTTAATIVNKINSLLFGGEMQPGDRTELITFLTTNGLDEWRVREAFALALASASFQWF